MANPLGLVAGAVGIGSTIAGGAAQVAGAQANLQAQQLGIQGQMLQTLGTAFGFQTQAQQYEYQSNINKYQAGVAKVNEDIAKSNANYERDMGEVDAQQAGMKSRYELGEMKASQGASGIDVNSGSSTRVRESMIDLGYYNQTLIRSSAAKKAYGYEVEATQDEAQADVYRYTAAMNEDQAKNALTASDMTMKALPLQQQAMGVASQAASAQIAGSIAGTVGSVASKWLTMSSMI
jgi:hypothetical protein